MKTNRRVAAAAAAVLAAMGIYVAVPSGPGWYETPETQEIRYQTVPMEAQGWGAYYEDINEVMKVMRKHLTPHRGVGFVLRPSNRASWSSVNSLDRTLQLMRDHLLTGPQDLSWIVRSETDKYRERAHRVDIDPTAMADTEGVEAIDIIVGTVNQHFPELDVWGIFVCRRTVYGGWSQHAWANAVDFGGSYSDMNNAANYMYDITRAGWLPASQILWDYENMLTGSYVYNHTNHIHVSGAPLRTGTPPCVGG